LKQLLNSSIYNECGGPYYSFTYNAKTRKTPPYNAKATRIAAPATTPAASSLDAAAWETVAGGLDEAEAAA
jgi:hypothetical protein